MSMGRGCRQRQLSVKLPLDSQQSIFFKKGNPLNTFMSATADARHSLPDLAPMSAPLRNLALTLALTFSSLALVGLTWGGTGYEMLIVAMGWPHVILGFLFYFGKVLRGDAGARSAFIFLVGVTLVFWLLHYLFALTALIYLYFLYHAFRDEISIYLNTRARHLSRANLYALGGITPLILLMLVIPQPPDFRHDLRRTEFTGSAFSATGPTLIRFKPIPNSGGRDFYFSLQAPDTEGLRAFTTDGSRADITPSGEIRIADEPWKQAADLNFAPFYADGRNAEAAQPMTGALLTPDTTATSAQPNQDSLPVLLTGGHRVGQTFRAGRDNLAGIWLPVHRFEDDGNRTRFIFRISSPPLLPLTPFGARLRFALIVLLSLIMLWRLRPVLFEHKQLWLYLAMFALLFAGLQYGLKLSTRAGYDMPMIFQLVVVFHYWSWYVFSLNKMRAPASASLAAPPANTYERLLGRLKQLPQFLVAMLTLNLLSAAAAFWYYRSGHAPASVRFFLDYNYFLYFLVLHVTFSFAPKLNARTWWSRFRGFGARGKLNGAGA